MIIAADCYIQKDNKTLMLHRTKKQNDINEGKWIGVGGKQEDGETPEECMLREVKEESGLIIEEFKLEGMITFRTLNTNDEDLLIFIYTATKFSGEIIECDEGDLEWIETNKIKELNLWEGDRLFWQWIIEKRGIFSAKFVYDKDELIEYNVRFYN